MISSVRPLVGQAMVDGTGRPRTPLAAGAAVVIERTTSRPRLPRTRATSSGAAYGMAKTSALAVSRRTSSSQSPASPGLSPATVSVPSRMR